MTTTRKSIYLVETDFGDLGRAYRETDATDSTFTDRSALIEAIADGQFDEVVSVHLIDFSAGTVTDVSADIGGEVDAILDYRGIAPSDEDLRTILNLSQSGGEFRDDDR